MNGQDADTLVFFTRVEPLFGNAGEAASGQLVSYSIIQGSEEKELVLLRSESPEFMDETETREGLILIDGLQALNFTYYDHEGNVEEQWDSDSEEHNGSLPSMVSIELEFLNYENPEAPLRIMTGVATPAN
jgi:hypothetical protein